MKNLYLIKTTVSKHHVVAETMQNAISLFQKIANKENYTFKEVNKIKLIETDIIF